MYSHHSCTTSVKEHAPFRHTPREAGADVLPEHSHLNDAQPASKSIADEKARASLLDLQIIIPPAMVAAALG